MSDPRVIGLDPSITETGLCDPDGVTHRCHIEPGAASGLDPTVALLRKIHAVRDWCSQHTDGASLVVMEEPYIDPKRPGNVKPLMWLQHALLNRFMLRRVPWVLVAPAQLKAYAASGRASKEEVHDSALGLGWQGPTHPDRHGRNYNESDAFICWAIARHIEDGEPRVLTPDSRLAKYRRELASDLAARMRRTAA